MEDLVMDMPSNGINAWKERKGKERRAKKTKATNILARR
jgi:hypothetical protein